MKYLSKGFTLIELLIVIAVLGVLVTAVLVALNPLEQLRRANDSGRINSVSQIGNAVQAFYTAQGATFPTATGGFQ
ncbi:MAG: type II secretion system protein, partial [Patescibacteria group bacterium]